MNTPYSPFAPPLESVSVVIPNYNCARYLPEAIDSVLKQTHQPCELIVVDDGSSDSSLEVAARYSASVTLIPLAHTGRPGLVRNRGIELARGNFIAFIDADDVWLPEKLATQLGYLRTHPGTALVHSNLDVIDASGRYLRQIFVGRPGSQGLSDEYPEPCFAQLLNGDSSVWTSSVLIRRECLERVGGFAEDLTIGEDYYLWIRLAREFRVGYIKEPLARHRKHGGNTGTNHASLFPPHEVRLWNKIVRLYPEIQKSHGSLIHAKCLFHYLIAALRSARSRRYLVAVRLATVGIAAHLTRARYGDIKRTAAKYLAIRRLQRQQEAR
jgi:glycosyltransferase involved in cell wall biosynthesis